MVLFADVAAFRRIDHVRAQFLVAQELGDGRLAGQPAALQLVVLLGALPLQELVCVLMLLELGLVDGGAARLVHLFIFLAF